MVGAGHRGCPTLRRWGTRRPRRSAARGELPPPDESGRRRAGRSRARPRRRRRPRSALAAPSATLPTARRGPPAARSRASPRGALCCRRARRSPGSSSRSLRLAVTWLRISRRRQGSAGPRSAPGRHGSRRQSGAGTDEVARRPWCGGGTRLGRPGAGSHSSGDSPPATEAAITARADAPERDAPVSADAGRPRG